MPYQSDKQRRWAHTDSAKKAGFPTEEFDEASKGKKLPEKAKKPKMAEGGVVPSDLTWKEKLMQYMLDNFGQPKHEMGSNLKGFSNLLQHKPQTENAFDEIDRLERGPSLSTGTPQGYAKGGIINDQTSGPDFLNALNQGSVPSLQFNPNAGLPPAPAPVMPPQTPQMPIQAPNSIKPYLDTQRQNLSKFGPEEQLALSQNLVKQRQSLPQKGAVALGGIADALTRVGGGQSNYGGQIQEQQNRLAGEQTGVLEKAGIQNIARLEQTQKLDAMDPNSPLSKVAQQTWGALLARNGFKPAQIAQMPASAIAALTGQTVETLKAESEAKMAAAALGLKTQEAAQTVKHQTAEEDVARAGQVMKAGEELRSHPIQRLFGILPGQKGLEDIVNQAETPALSPQDQDAISWAHANPTDPRASKILKLHGMQ